MTERPQAQTERPIAGLLLLMCLTFVHFAAIVMRSKVWLFRWSLMKREQNFARRHICSSSSWLNLRGASLFCVLSFRWCAGRVLRGFLSKAQAGT